MEGDLKTMHVKIVSAVRSNNDYNNQPTVLVTFEWTNNTDKKQFVCNPRQPASVPKWASSRHRHLQREPCRIRFNSDFAEVSPEPPEP